MRKRTTASGSRRKAATAADGAAGFGMIPSARHLHGRVMREIALRILAGTYKPGANIPSEAEFCAELGVSRTALREAIKLLSSKGLVTPRVRVGTIVNPWSQWNFLDPFILESLLGIKDVGPLLVKLFDMRKALEPAAAALAAQHASCDDLQALRRAFDDMNAATDDFDAWIDADLRFHQAIYLATGNEFFWPVGRLLKPALLASFRVTSRASHHHQHCLPEHRAVHDAILARDPARAYRAVVDLMTTSDADLVQVLDSSAGLRTARPDESGPRERTSASKAKAGTKV